MMLCMMIPFSAQGSANDDSLQSTLVTTEQTTHNIINATVSTEPQQFATNFNDENDADVLENIKNLTEENKMLQSSIAAIKDEFAQKIAETNKRNIQEHLLLRINLENAQNEQKALIDTKIALEAQVQAIETEKEKSEELLINQISDLQVELQSNDDLLSNLQEEYNRSQDTIMVLTENDNPLIHVLHELLTKLPKQPASNPDGDEKSVTQKIDALQATITCQEDTINRLTNNITSLTDNTYWLNASVVSLVAINAVTAIIYYLYNHAVESNQQLHDEIQQVLEQNPELILAYKASGNNQALEMLIAQCMEKTAHKTSPSTMKRLICTMLDDQPSVAPIRQ